MFCWDAVGCTAGTFAPAEVPVYGELNVGFSHTFANLLLPTLPRGHGIVLVNTGKGGSSFHSGDWTAPDGGLTMLSVSVVRKLATALPKTLGGSLTLDAMLWHQGEGDASDNVDAYYADCDTYLDELSGLVSHLSSEFDGASASTPFVNGGLLPYWSAPNGRRESLLSVKNLCR